MTSRKWGQFHGDRAGGQGQGIRGDSDSPKLTKSRRKGYFNVQT